MTSPQNIFQRSFRIVWMLIRLSLILTLSFWLLQWDSRIKIHAFGWDIDITAGAGVIALVVIVALTWLILGIIRSVFSIRRFWCHIRHRHHIKRAGESFDRGVISFFSEEYRDALHHFSSAAHHNPPRYDLYCVFMGICAWKSNQMDIAKRYFQQLLLTERFAFMGYYGLYHVNNEPSSHISLLEEARHKTKDNPWVLHKLLEAYEKNQSAYALDKAKALILTLYDKKYINKTERRQRTASVLWSQAKDALHHSNIELANRLAKQSYEQNELFEPAVLYLSTTETPKHAEKILSKLFITHPSATLAEALFKHIDKTTEAFHRFEQMLTPHQHVEHALFLGKLAIEAKLWGRSKQIITSIPYEKRDNRFYEIERQTINEKRD